MVNRLAMKKGFTLLELTVVMVIVGVLLKTIIGNCTNYINRAKFQATVREMGSIAQAAIDYYNSSNNPNDQSNSKPLAWPSNPSLLSNNSDSNYNNLPQSVTINPFGYSYQLSYGNNMATVSTIIPNGILIDPTEGSFINITSVAGGKQISVSQSISNEYTGRLAYDLQYLDK